MPNLQEKFETGSTTRMVNSEQKEKFISHLTHDAALASNNFRDNHFDLTEAKHRSREALCVLGATEGLQAMLAAQLLSIHQLQQKTMLYANAIDDFKLKQYYTNSAVKLSNCFVQQANMLAKLQGIGQKITIERVDVHSGGQAIVGAVQGGCP